MYIYVGLGPIYIITTSLIPANFSLQEDTTNFVSVYSIYKIIRHVKLGTYLLIVKNGRRQRKNIDILHASTGINPEL